MKLWPLCCQEVKFNNYLITSFEKILQNFLRLFQLQSKHFDCNKHNLVLVDLFRQFTMKLVALNSLHVEKQSASELNYLDL